MTGDKTPRIDRDGSDDNIPSLPITPDTNQDNDSVVILKDDDDDDEEEEEDGDEEETQSNKQFNQHNHHNQHNDKNDNHNDKKEEIKDNDSIKQLRLTKKRKSNEVPCLLQNKEHLLIEQLQTQTQSQEKQLQNTQFTQQNRKQQQQEKYHKLFENDIKNDNDNDNNDGDNNDENFVYSYNETQESLEMHNDTTTLNPQRKGNSFDSVFVGTELDAGTVAPTINAAKQILHNANEAEWADQIEGPGYYFFGIIDVLQTWNTLCCLLFLLCCIVCIVCFCVLCLFFLLFERRKDSLNLFFLVFFLILFVLFEHVVIVLGLVCLYFLTQIHTGAVCVFLFV